MAFKMKGDPMKRNFGISPMKKDDDEIVKYSELPKDKQEAAKKFNLDTYGTLNPTAEAKKFGVTKKQLADFHKKSIKLQDMYKQSGRNPIKNPISEKEYKSEEGGLSKKARAYINLMRHDKPHRYYGLSDERIAQILRKEKERKARKAKFKPGTSDPR
tara:strand:+ start:451 stop:924 length:474 start_codon:yes stop_codon:yes gene_type:complete